MGLLEIKKLSDDELKDTAKKFKIENYKTMPRYDLEKAVDMALIKWELESQARVKAELKVTADIQLKAAGIGAKKKFTSPEAEAIEKSKKVYALFNNIENPGNTEHFNKGCVYDFTLYDGKVHILPQWLIDDLTRTISATKPEYITSPHPISKEPISRRSGVKRKFVFQILDDAPKDSKFGVVLDEKVLKKFNLVGDDILSESKIQVEV